MFMKIILGLTTICAGLVLFSSCRIETIDYRDKYCGSWSNTVEVEKHNYDSIGQDESDTISFIGSVSRASADSEINIQYLPGSSITLTIDDSGKLTGFPNAHGNGEFDGESVLHLGLGWGGLGGGMYLDLNGAKE
jgi:hypothetical protein